MSSNKASKPLELYHLTSRSSNASHSSKAASYSANSHYSLAISQTASLSECLTILATKIDERFKKVNAAFRYFDIRSEGKISFSDFCFVLE